MRLLRDSPVPLYQQLLNEVRARIEAGTWATGSRLPNEVDLANELGVSRITIRQALGAAVDAGLLVRVRGKGTFVAKAQSAPSRGFIGHVIPYLSHSFNVQILVGIESVVKSEGYRLTFANSEGDVAAEQILLEQLRAEGMTGCIVEPVYGEDAALQELISEHYPVVLLDRYPVGLEVDMVASDHFGGGYIVVQHLIAQGYTNIVYLASEPLKLSSITERRAGYLAAMQEAGLVARDTFVIDGARERGFFQNAATFVQQEAGAVAQIASWLGSAARPEAIVAMNDLMALLVLAAAEQAHLQIPHELALVGFDDCDFAASCQPPLTTVAQPSYQLGVEAARLLLRRVRGEQGPAQQLRLPTELVVRKSSLGVAWRTSPADSPGLIPAVQASAGDRAEQVSPVPLVGLAHSPPN